MGSDWIKMRTELYRDPKVSAITDSLLDPEGALWAYVNQNEQCDMAVTRNVMRNAAIGALVSVWGIARHQGRRKGDDLVLDSTLDSIDDIADLPGFGQAMLDAGWLRVNGTTLKFPRFFADHNVDPFEDQKKKNRERQRRYRDKQRHVTGNVTGNVTVTDRVEKRESKSERKVNQKKMPPTVGDVRAYCEQRGNNINPQKFIDYYDANGWVQGRGKPIKDWKAAIRCWEQKEKEFDDRNGKTQSGVGRRTRAEQREAANAAAFEAVFGGGSSAGEIVCDEENAGVHTV